MTRFARHERAQHAGFQINHFDLKSVSNAIDRVFLFAVPGPLRVVELPAVLGDEALMEKAEKQIATFTCARLLFTAVAIPGIISQQGLEYYKNEAISAVEQGLEPLCF